MENKFTIKYEYLEDGKRWESSYLRTVDHNDILFLKDECLKNNGNLPGFKFLKITQNNSLFDNDLRERMASVRSMCELGHKIRAEHKIKNRQPLNKAYIFIANEDAQNYMIYADEKNNFYSNLIADELNVLNVEFISNPDEFLDINLKPNFKVLGPKGFGKQAQSLKTYLSNLDIADKKKLFSEISSGEKKELTGIEIVLEDLEVQYVPKSGFVSANNKFGVVILDTKITSFLSELCFVAEFRAAIQGIRKTANLELTENIFLEIFCNENQKKTLENHSKKLSRDLLAKDIKFFLNSDLKDGNPLIHKIEIEKEILSILVYRENLCEKK